MPTEAEVMPSAEFVRRLKEEIAGSPKQRVNHPFVRAVCERRATMEQIRQWAVQDYQFRRAVPRLAMVRYLACTDPVFQSKLYEVFEDETQGLCGSLAASAVPNQAIAPATNRAMPTVNAARISRDRRSPKIRLA